VRYATLNHMQTGGTDKVWKIKLANGTYIVYLVMGDPDYVNQVNSVSIEGVVKEDPDGADNFDEYHAIVEVTDNRLTIAPATGSVNAKICFVEITVDELNNVENITSDQSNFELYQNTPNPFNNLTEIKYCLQKNGYTRLKVFNLQGHFITDLVNEYQTTGSYQVVFNATGLPTGIYFYHLQCGEFSAIRKMVILK